MVGMTDRTVHDEIDTEPFVPFDIPSIAAKYNPKLAKRIPKFLYRKLEKILCIKQLNDGLIPGCKGDGQFYLDYIVNYIGFKMEFQGPGVSELEKLKGQSVMFVSNHPFGGPEGLGLFRWIYPKFPEARLLTQSMLGAIPTMKKFSVFNGRDVSTLNKAVEENRSLLFFPAGYCSRYLSFGDVFDYEWKPSFVKIAKRNRQPIVVFFIEGHVSKRTLNWTRIRKFFHIKTSFETIYLVDEMFKMKGQTLKVIVSKPIMPETFDDENINKHDWAQRLRQYCYELKTNPDAEFDPSKPATLPLT